MIVVNVLMNKECISLQWNTGPRQAHMNIANAATKKATGDPAALVILDERVEKFMITPAPPLHL